MNLRDEIERAAYDLYEKGGRLDGKETENWLEAERIVLARNPMGTKTNAGKEAQIARPQTKTPSGAKARTAKV
ncbi:MAG: DUF2934 domain-containing protein [Deltaproteobacteria bacterium]|nr:DUF2934 domain-containing protein [Deltaproteobacteria bacterium]